MTYSPKGIHRAGRRKRIEALVIRLIGEYQQGRSASACMDELIKEAKK